MNEIHIPASDDDRVLRNVELDGYRLMLWDTGRRGIAEKDMLGYALWVPGAWEGEPLFVGEDYGASPMHAIDSDDTLRGIIGFLTLKPGDTDDEYFENYTPEQMAFAESDAESLSLWGMEPQSDDEYPPPEFRDLDTGALSGLGASGVDEDAATELELFIENDGQLYERQTKSIQKNMAKKIAAGKYDPALAIVGWRHLVDEGAKKYHKEFGSGGKWSDMFNVPTRDAVARSMAEGFFNEVKTQGPAAFAGGLGYGGHADRRHTKRGDERADYEQGREDATHEARNASDNEIREYLASSRADDRGGRNHYTRGYNEVMRARVGGAGIGDTSLHDSDGFGGGLGAFFAGLGRWTPRG